MTWGKSRAERAYLICGEGQQPHASAWTKDTMNQIDEHCNTGWRLVRNGYTCGLLGSFQDDASAQL